MTRIRHLAFLLLLMTLAVLGGCGGGGDDGPAAVQLDAARTARATLDTAGGSITATAADGRRYTLIVPPGALATATEITATPVISMGDAPLAAGLKGAVRFGPSGLRFARPATLRIEGASTTVDAGTSLVGFNRSADGQRMELGLPTVAGSAIELQVRHFTDVGVSQATPQQVAAVPAAAAPADTVDAIVNAIFDALGREHAGVPADRRTDADVAAMFIRVHDSLVAPRFRAPALATPEGRDLAIIAARAWLAFTVLAFDDSLPFAALPGGLGALTTTVRQQLLGVLTTNFDAGLAECTAEPPSRPFQVAGLVSALRAAQVAVDLRNVRGGLPGLDAVTVGRRLNDCVRVVIVPSPLPAFEVGRQASLDVQAQLIFANDASTTERALFAFTLSSDDAAIANPQGFSDTQGAYTSVVTPRVSAPRFGVAACMVIVDDLGTNVGSSLCGQQTLAAATTSVVLAGRARRILDGADPEGGVSFSHRGTVDMRVRADADGRLTVLEATGRVRKETTATVLCRPDPLSTATRTVSLTEVHQHTITSGRFVEDPVRPGFMFSGPTTSTQQVIRNRDLSCDIETVSRTIDDGDDFGLTRIIARELAPDGLPASFTLGDFTGSADGAIRGRLLRE